MSYQPFHVSRIGAAHIRRQLPCQDASASEIYRDACIAVVADGHGSRRHFRSERGSAIACQVALEQIHIFLDACETDDRPMDERLTELKRAICDAWLAAVRSDCEADPWTEAELDEEQKILSEAQFEALTDGTDAPIAYGSTLCAVFMRDGAWAAVQLGDGCFVHIGTDGLYEWPMPESMVNEGNRTASLCMREPMRDFRHCWGMDRPAGLLVYSDGIEKTFPPEGKEVISLLHWIWRNERGGASERAENLARTLDMLTQRSPIGDDVSIAGLVDSEAEDMEPVPGQGQLRQELERLNAQIAEIESTIQYNKQRLRVARENEGDVQSGAVEQLQSIIERKQASAAALHERAAELRRALGEPEIEEPEIEEVEIEESEPEPEDVVEPKVEPKPKAAPKPEVLNVFDVDDLFDLEKLKAVKDAFTWVLEPVDDDFLDPLGALRRLLKRK